MNRQKSTEIKVIGRSREEAFARTGQRARSSIGGIPFFLRFYACLRELALHASIDVKRSRGEENPLTELDARATSSSRHSGRRARIDVRRHVAACGVLAHGPTVWSSNLGGTVFSSRHKGMSTARYCGRLLCRDPTRGLLVGRVPSKKRLLSPYESRQCRSRHVPD